MTDLVAMWIGAFWQLCIMGLFLAFSVIVHETGHIIAFMLYGIKPDITWKSWYVEIGSKFHRKVNLKQTIIIGFAGVLSGLLVIYMTKFYLPTNWYYSMLICYVVGCALDIILICTCLNEKDKCVSLYDLQVRLAKEYEATY